jgi:predicted Zn-dependent protease
VESPHQFKEVANSLAIDKKVWEDRVRNLARLYRQHKDITDANVSFSATRTVRYLVSSEGAQIEDEHIQYRVFTTATTIADDNGPAILMEEAAGVFFHETFGHRIEGHRQKNEDEGRTFAKKVGQKVMPDFITVTDDPTRQRLGSKPLNGYYKFDDEGVQAQPVTLVDKGMLKTFLMSRSPIKDFSVSNGHGRCSPGADPVARQANLIVDSSKRVPYEKLREMLIAEAKRQGKPYGLVFDEIAGGFTMTAAYMPQVYKLLPLRVWRVYTDGRPDELLRGVDLIGTPLASLERIVCGADDDDTFNGTCGAESGWVPVSASSPSLLVDTIEVERQHKAQDKPPLLPPPATENKDGSKKDDGKKASLDAAGKGGSQ